MDGSSDIPPVSLGHNGGPALDDLPFAWGEAPIDVYYAWKRAHEAVWKNVSYNTLLRRVTAAAALGLTYEEYVLELLYNGRHLQLGDAGRIAAIKTSRRRPA
ncbi:MAG: hypothetical protein LCH46_13370 [Proteobacteria bacterium]|nr:hypothetical protein [Pseudomonadota bacterium]